MCSLILTSALGCRFDESGPGFAADVDSAVLPDASADLDAAFDAELDAPGPDAGATCAEGETRCGDARELEICQSDGSWSSQECLLTCLDGDIPTGIAAACEEPAKPSNGIDPGALIDLDTVPPEVPKNSVVVLDTDMGRVHLCGFGDLPVSSNGQKMFHFEVVAQPDGSPDIGVFGFAAFVVPEKVQARFIGKNSAALLVRGAVAIKGEVLASAGACEVEEACAGVITGRCSGPGGGSGGKLNVDSEQPVDANGAGPGGGGFGRSGTMPFGSIPERGGGGGGYGASGGNGGGMSNAGFSYGETNLTPLVGGSGGGGGGAGATAMGGVGGGGGGALQITSYVGIVVEETGELTAAGSGGGASDKKGNGGGGGGSGGALLLEAPRIEIAGQVAANGGGGGGGSDDSVAREAGDPGGFGDVPAAGGSGQFVGGKGGARSAQQGGDGEGDQFNDGTAGGGGAVGRIYLRTSPGRPPVGGDISPDPESGSDFAP